MFPERSSNTRMAASAGAMHLLAKLNQLKCQVAQDATSLNVLSQNLVYGSFLWRLVEPQTSLKATCIENCTLNGI